MVKEVLEGLWEGFSGCLGGEVVGPKERRKWHSINRDVHDLGRYCSLLSLFVLDGFFDALSSLHHQDQAGFVQVSRLVRLRIRRLRTMALAMISSSNSTRRPTPMD